MAFDEAVEKGARRRAHGTCECTERSCPHFGRCRVPGAQFHHKKALDAGGTDELTNCLFMCKACHDRAHKGSKAVGRL